MTSFKHSQARYIKGTHKTTNFTEHEASLRQRGSLAVSRYALAPTGEIIASDLASQSAPDASRVPALLKETDTPIASVRADGAFDNEGVYTAVENHTDSRSPRTWNRGFDGAYSRL